MTARAAGGGRAAADRDRPPARRPSGSRSGSSTATSPLAAERLAQRDRAAARGAGGANPDGAPGPAGRRRSATPPRPTAAAAQAEHEPDPAASSAAAPRPRRMVRRRLGEQRELVRRLEEELQSAGADAPLARGRAHRARGRARVAPGAGGAGRGPQRRPRGRAGHRRATARPCDRAGPFRQPRGPAGRGGGGARPPPRGGGPRAGGAGPLGRGARPRNRSPSSPRAGRRWRSSSASAWASRPAPRRCWPRATASATRVLGPLSDFVRTGREHAELAERLLGEWMHAVLVRDLRRGRRDPARGTPRSSPGALVLLPADPGPGARRRRAAGWTTGCRPRARRPAWVRAALAGSRGAGRRRPGAPARQRRHLPGRGGRRRPARSAGGPSSRRLGQDVGARQRCAGRRRAPSRRHRRAPGASWSTRSADGRRAAERSRARRSGRPSPRAEDAARLVGNLTPRAGRGREPSWRGSPSGSPGPSSGWSRSTPRWPRETSARARLDEELGQPRARPWPTSRPSRRAPASSGSIGRCRRRTWPPASRPPPSGWTAPAQTGAEAEAGDPRPHRRAGAAGPGRRPRSPPSRRQWQRAAGRARGRPARARGRRRRRRARAGRDAEPRWQTRRAGPGRPARAGSRRTDEESHRLQLELTEAAGAAAASIERVETEWRKPLRRAARRRRRCSISTSRRSRPRPARIVGALEAIGPVNPLAVEEHAEESKRLEFLRRSGTTWWRRGSRCIQAIREIDGTARAMFLETFNAVQAQLPHRLPDAVRRRRVRPPPRQPGRSRSRARSRSTPPRAASAPSAIHLLSLGRADPGRGVAAVQHLPDQAEPVLPHGRGGRAARRRQRGPVHPAARGVQAPAPSSSSSPTTRAPCRRPTRSTASPCRSPGVSTIVGVAAERSTATRPVAA